MVSRILVPAQDGTPKQIVLADHATDFTSPAIDLRKTTDGSQELDVQMDMTSLADGAARQSAKFDFGSLRALEYSIRCAFEFNATGLTAGEVVELWMGFSHHATAGTANPGNLSGSDAAYTGYSANLAESVRHLIRVGTFVCTAQAATTVQIAHAGLFTPRARYGILVPKNESGAAFHSDANEIHVVLDPIATEAQ